MPTEILYAGLGLRLQNQRIPRSQHLLTPRLRVCIFLRMNESFFMSRVKTLARESLHLQRAHIVPSPLHDHDTYMMSAKYAHETSSRHSKRAAATVHRGFRRTDAAPSAKKTRHRIFLARGLEREHASGYPAALGGAFKHSFRHSTPVCLAHMVLVYVHVDVPDNRLAHSFRAVQVSHI